MTTGRGTRPGGPAGPGGRAARQRADRMIAANREELKKADVRATQVLGAAMAMATAWLGLLPASLAGGGRPWWWWFGLATWAVGTSAAAAALVPQLGGSRDPGELAYFGHVTALDDAALHAALHGDELTGVLAELRWTSRAVVLKYRLVRVAMAGLAATAVSSVAGLW